jgi:DNA-directed RNA polymerase subunit beta'
MITTAGQAIINAMLPRQHRDYRRELNKKSLLALMNNVAKTHTKEYSDIALRLQKIGRKVAYLDGASYTLDDFRSPIGKEDLYRKAEELEKGKIPADKIGAEFYQLQKDMIKKSLAAGLKKGTTLAKMVHSGSKGKPNQYLTATYSPIMYTDNLNRPIPLAIKNSISDGLTPAEFFAGSFGTRKGAVATKFATPEGGFFNKQVGYVAGNLLVSTEDCGTDNGVSCKADDPENIGRQLAAPVASFPKGTLITDRVIADLLKKKKDTIVIRSPISCEADSGVCQKCYGHNEKGMIPSVGDDVGINSSAALTEPFTQGAMNVKHSGGVIGKSKSGMALVQQLLKIPKVFAGGATVAEIDGKIIKTEEAPQGGFFVSVGDQRHYIQPHQKLKVKIGDSIERGLPLSDGIINPADVTRLRGIGEGRKFLANSLKEAYTDDDKGFINKIHMEVLAKAMNSNVRINDHTQFKDHVPGDIVSVALAQKSYSPNGVKEVLTSQAKDKYLAKPYLHYSMGTRLTPKMTEEIFLHGAKKIKVTDEEPPFSPMMVRLDDVPSTKENWLSRLYSIHLKQKILTSTHRGEEAKIHGSDFIPSYIRGTEFGKKKHEY